MYSVLKLRTGYRGILLAALLGTACLVTQASAASLPLVPLTKLRLTVVQFVASTGDYKRWDALGGDLDVGPDGSLTVPTLGPIDVSSMNPDQLGAEIARRLQAKLGLLDAPDATVQVLAYPPVYVVGGVANPGQYVFQPGMTVAQAMALAGGEHRSEAGSTVSETIKLEADLTGLDRDILRTTARIARLKSEFAKAAAIEFPSQLNVSAPSTAEIVAQEQQIFEAHANELARQQTGLTQLGELYTAEIDAMKQKSAALELQIAQAEKQVEGIKSLVNAGSATVSRLNDAERALSDLRSEALDTVIATMRAREGLNSSERDLAKLQDMQQSETARQLQQEQAALEKMLLDQTSTMRMLRQSVEFDHEMIQAKTVRSTLSYTILRQQASQPVSLVASEDSVLQPGDLVKVTLKLEAPDSVIGLAENESSL